MLLLALEGGGMRAGFVAGAVMAMMDLGLGGFDRALAVSASVPTLAYFAAGQRADMESVWREELNTPKLVCYRNIPVASLTLSVRKPILNIDYLIYDVFKQKYPLNLQAVLASGIACHFAATVVPQASLQWFRPGDHDIYKTFKACLAVPGCYPETVCLGHYEYVDGGTVCPLPVKSLFNTRIDRVLAVLSRPPHSDNNPPSFLERTLFWRYFKKYDWMKEKLVGAAQSYDAEVSLLESLARQEPPKAFIISPEKTPPAKFVTRDHMKINRTIDLGYNRVESLEQQIRGFLEKS